MKLERLISMIYKLLNNEVLSATVLAEQYQVSPRTIYRDIDVICAAGIPVVSYQGTKGGYGIMDGYKMDKSLLGSYDVNSLISVLHSLSSVFEDERAQETIERLQTIDAGHQQLSLLVDFETHRSASEALRNVREGILRCRVISFHYINVRNERSSREVEPVRLHFKYRNWYIYGFCRTREEYREFRLSRMMNVLLTDTTFEPHQEVPEHAKDAGVPGAVEEVVILVRPGALAEALDQFHEADTEFRQDGSMLIRIPVCHPLGARWLWSILLSFGSGAEVLKPPALRDILKEQLQNALKYYEEV